MYFTFLFSESKNNCSGKKKNDLVTYNHVNIKEKAYFHVTQIISLIGPNTSSCCKVYSHLSHVMWAQCTCHLLFYFQHLQKGMPPQFKKVPP